MFHPKTYTVESVTSGHPDKVCDQISDAILDECLRQDPKSRVAMESFGAHGMLVIGGEVTTAAQVDYAAVGEKVYREIGYADPLSLHVNVVKQSPDIAQGVDTGGAGDQGIMYGYATDETPAFMPPGVMLTHALTRGLERLRVTRALPWLGPDGKAQATYQNGRVTKILVSCQHAATVTQSDIREAIRRELILPLLGFDPSVSDEVLCRDAGLELLVNPTGSFVLGGFRADTGLTGRKIMVDTYGGLASHGGGAFSGKDPSKVDRSAAYMARFVAKSLVANGHAKQCLVSVAYAIGRAEPLMVEAHDETGRDVSELAQRFDFRPAAIIERLGLRRPIYRATASYGHFGKPGLPWEEIVAI